MEFLYDVMDKIKNRKFKPLSAEQRDELERKYEVGKYRKWAYDEQRCREILVETQEINSRCGSSGPRPQYNKPETYTTKKQQEEERKKIILEIENG